MVTSEVHSRISIFKTGKVTHLCICDKLNIKSFDKKVNYFKNLIIYNLLFAILIEVKLHGYQEYIHILVSNLF